MAEARLAIGAGASAIGLVARMPSGPGPIDESLIAEITAAVSGQIDTFLLTSEVTAGRIIAQHRRTRTTTLQLTDALADGEYGKLRDALPGVGLVQVVHVMGSESVDEAVRVEPHVDAVLLDSGNPGLAIKELGGTGRVHDWSVSRRIVQAVNMPVYLAGGLTPDNVADAIAAVSPYAVDVCSGVRTDGALDPRKLEGFVEQVCATSQ